MDTEGEFSNGSFCGNDIDTQPPMSRKYFVDTCLRIVEWFDVDGFRFDLMGILDYNLMNEIAEKCRALKPDFYDLWRRLEYAKLCAGASKSFRC